MYSFCSNALLNAPQAAIESGACGSRIAISRRAFGCAMGTNRAPGARSAHRRLPGAGHGRALVAFHRHRRELHAVGVEGFHRGLRRACAKGAEVDAVHAQLLAHARRVLRRHHIAAGGRRHAAPGDDGVAQRQHPQLRGALVVAGHAGAGDLRRRAGVRVAQEFDEAPGIGGGVVQRLPAVRPARRRARRPPAPAAATAGRVRRPAPARPATVL